MLDRIKTGLKKTAWAITKPIRMLRGFLTFLWMLTNFLFWGSVNIITALPLMLLRAVGVKDNNIICRALLAINQFITRLHNYFSVGFSFKFLSSVNLNIKLPKDINSKKVAVVVANHQSFVDWMILAYVLGQTNIGLVNFVIKNDWTTNLPWMISTTRAQPYIYTDRTKGSAVSIYEKAKKIFSWIASYALIIFVEGTVYDKTTHQDQKNKQDNQYKHLLNPRPKGTAAILQAISDSDNIKPEDVQIIDVTISASGAHLDGPQITTGGFFAGEMESITIDVENTDLPLPPPSKELPDKLPENLCNALTTLFHHKDEKLEKVAAENKKLKASFEGVSTEYQATQLPATLTA